MYLPAKVDADEVVGMQPQPFTALLPKTRRAIQELNSCFVAYQGELQMWNS